MEISIGSTFSREFTWEERTITLELTKSLNASFENKNYGEIDLIYVSAICVSKGFKPFFKQKRNRWSKEKNALEYEYELDFDTFFHLNLSDKKDKIIQEFLSKTREVSKNYKNKIDFNWEVFLDDLEKSLS